MKPQINLYNPQLRSAREIFSFRVLMIGVAGVLALAALGYAWYALQAGDRERQARELDARLQAMREETVALSKAIGERGPNPALMEKQKRLEARHAEMEAVRAALEQLTGASAAGFSEFLRAFARQTMQGVWLTGLSVAADGSEMHIDGRTANPDLVPAYIARLNSEPLLQGRSFAQFTVRQPPVEAAPAAAKSPAQGQQAAPAYHEFRLVSSLANGVSGKGEAP